MDQHAHSSKIRSRRSFIKSTSAAVGIIVGMSDPLILGGQTRRRNRTRDKVRQTSPITIGGGGSVSIHFDRCWYTDDNNGKPKQYWNRGDEIEKLWIINEDGASFPYPQAMPGKVITVEMRTKTGKLGKIEITCKPLGIEFEPGEFPYDPVKDIHFNADYKITRVWVSGIGTPIFEAKDGKCWIRIDDPAR